MLRNCLWTTMELQRLRMRMLSNQIVNVNGVDIWIVSI